MSIEAVRLGISNLQAAISALETETRVNAEVRLRAVAIKAKNLNPSDVIEWPYDWGRAEVVGWARSDGLVTVTQASGRCATFDAEERVRVYR
jgi:hypothetical protein